MLCILEGGLSVKLRTIAFVMAALCAASKCMAQGSDVQRISYAQYGFEFSLPKGYVKAPVPQNAPDGWIEVYTGGVLAAGVGTGKIPPGKSVTAEVDTMARREGLGRTSFTTPQGVQFSGVAGTIRLTKEMIRAMPPSMPLREGTSVRLSAYMTGLPGGPSRMLVFFFAGMAEQSSQVDGLATSVLNSLHFTGLKPGLATAGAQATNGGLSLVKGQIALYGKVEIIRTESRNLTMLADKVVPYGQRPAVLDPARQKVVMYSSLPAGVEAGCRILVIGRSAGTGKPMTADTIQVENPTPEKNPPP